MNTIALTTLATCLLLTAAVAAQQEGFTHHGRFTGIGGCLNRVAGPGPDEGSERLYASHIYGGDTLDIVAVDPATGASEVFASPIATEIGAWALALGPDGALYVGTLPNAHILKLDWEERTLVDMGRPSGTEQYIWQLALATDGKLYGCTYPSAKLVRFDPSTANGEDLGRMDPTEQYARTVAADDHGFVYIGIGTVRRNLVAYEIATGEHRGILPAELEGEGFCGVTRGDDGSVYATAGGQSLRLEGWQAVLVDAGEVRPPAPLQIADGRTVSYTGTRIILHDAQTGATEEHETGYVGKSQALFRIGLGPDDRIYGSTAMPIHFLWADPETNDWAEIGQPGGGEFYSFLAHGDALIGAAYSGDAPLMIYRPGEPWAPGREPADNPWMIHYKGEDSGWRPMALVDGGNGEVYVGAVAGYGKLGGPLCALNPATGEVEQYLHLVPDQSVVALAMLDSGLLAGGTTVHGGGGSQPTQSEARLFLWDPATRTKVFETTPVPGEGAVSALATGRNGLVYGFAGRVLFVFDSEAQQVIHSAPHGLGGVIYNAVGQGTDGELYGLASGGIFTIDQQSHEPRVLASYAEGIDGGFAIRGQRIYFTSGPQIVSLALP